MMKFKRYVSLALVCFAYLCGTACSAGKTPALNPMESIVCQMGKNWCIVRDDQTRRNPFSLRDRKTLEPAFDAKFEKYLDTFEFGGKPFIAAANWNPAFEYLWNAWIYDGHQWLQLMQKPCVELKLIEEDGKPVRLEGTDIDGQPVSWMP